MNRIITILLLLLLPWYKVLAQVTETEDNYCVEFNGVSDYLDLGSESSLYLTYFTTEFWIYPYYQTNDSWHGFCGNELSNTTANRSPSVWVYKYKRIHWGFGTGSASDWSGGKCNATTTNNVLTLFAWNHVAITFDGIDYNLYVNGTLVYNHTGAKDLKPVKTPIRYFGRIDNYYKGMIDDIRVWAYARTADEIKDNMKVLMSGDEAGLIGYWTFNDQQLTAVDLSSRGNNGTLIGPNVKFIKMPLGDEDAIYVLQNAIPTQTLKVGETKDTVISWTFGHKPADAYNLTLASVSDETKARVSVIQTDYGDSTGTSLSIKGLKEGMITAKLAFDYGKYSLEHTFLIDIKSAEVGKLANHTDIGINGLGADVNGASFYSDGVYSLLDNGGSVGTTATDGGTFVSWDLTGDGDFQARILNEEDITATANYGVDIREDASVTNSKSFGAYVSKGTTQKVLSRIQTGGVSVQSASSATVLPTWLRLNRTGNVFTAYSSTDPTSTWNVLSSTTIDMKSTAKVGLFVASGNSDGARKKIKFDNVSLTGTLNVMNPLSDVRIMSVRTVTFDKTFSSGAINPKVTVIPDGVVKVGIDGTNMILTPLSIGVAQVILSVEKGSSTIQDTMEVEVGLLSSGWESADIWKTSLAASGVSFISMPSSDKVHINSVVMDKTESDATTTNVDGITFVGEKKLNAENQMQEITAYVKEVAVTGSGVRAGLMFRDSLDNGSVQVGLSCTAYEGLQLEYRWLNKVIIETRTVSGIKPPCWLKLTNYKGAYIAYYSTETESTVPSTTSWRCVLGNALIIQMSNTHNYAGVFSNTNSYHEGVAEFTNVSINSYDGHKITCNRTEITETVETNKGTVKSYPNPFSGKTKVEFTNSKKGKVDVRLYNCSGVELSVLYSGVANAGVQTYEVDLSSMPSGMYYCKVITSSGVEVVKLMQIK